MENIGKKIRTVRKSKGLSQEDLAELATVNVRTIQRIEAGENTPHGKTLQLICEALGVQSDEILEYNLKEDSTVLMWMYFSVASNIVLPLGNVIVPLILWVNNKSRVTGVDKIGRNIIYNQIVISAITFMFLTWVIYQKINHNVLIDFTYGFLIYWVLCLINIVFAVFAGIQTTKGKVLLYPLFR